MFGEGLNEEMFGVWSLQAHKAFLLRKEARVEWENSEFESDSRAKKARKK